MTSAKTGLEALLAPENSVLVLIDHQPFQFANLHSHEPTMIVNNVIGLAKAAKVFRVPTILTTVVEERGGYLIKGLSFSGAETDKPHIYQHMAGRPRRGSGEENRPEKIDLGCTLD